MRNQFGRLSQLTKISFPEKKRHLSFPEKSVHYALLFLRLLFYGVEYLTINGNGKIIVNARALEAVYRHHSAIKA